MKLWLEMYLKILFHLFVYIKSYCICHIVFLTCSLLMMYDVFCGWTTETRMELAEVRDVKVLFPEAMGDTI